MKIGIIGLGFVGLSFAAVLASKNYSIIGIDSDKEKVKKIKQGNVPFFEPNLNKTLKKALAKDLKISSNLSLIVEKCGLIFVTVGTPQLENGQINLSMIKSVVKEIAKNLSKTKNNPVIVIKSTVIPLTTKNIVLPILEKYSKLKEGKNFGLVTNPEFLREGKAIEDTIKPHVIVLGGNNNKFFTKIKKFYKQFHKNIPIISTNYQTAEIIKYANNSFLATKISFINQIASICEAIPGANVEDVAKVIGLDPRIGKMFLNAGPGYGGSCLPKDVKAIIKFSSKIGIKPILFDAVEDINQLQIKNLISTIEKSVGKLEGKTITVLGLAFKANTDDVRESVSIKLIKSLLRRGVKLKVHDPRAIENTKVIFGNSIQYESNVKDALRNSYCAVIITPWNDYSKISNNEIKFMKKKLIIDTRRLLVEKKLDAEYFAVGIGS